MNVNLTEAQIRYILSVVEPDVLAGIAVADAVERELDLALMDDEQRERERFEEAARKQQQWMRAEALAYLASRR